MAQLARLPKTHALRGEHDPIQRAYHRPPPAKTPVTDRRDRRDAAPPEVKRLPALHRVESIDALRGFTMFWILGGDALAWALRDMSAGASGILPAVGNLFGEQLTHVHWEGFTFYDLILPLFIFLVGVSIVFSLSRLVEREGLASAHLRVLRRSFLLYVLGLIYYGGVGSGWDDIRWLGVLQRIALCYFFASLLFLNFQLRGLIVAFAALIVGYWALMSFVPMPGLDAVSFAEGRNLANWIDREYLPGRKWDGNWDPEGLLSTLPAIATCLLGIFAGLLLKSGSLRTDGKSLWLVGSGVALVALGFIWGLQFPVIKKLWTSSYVLVSGGFSLILLGLFHQIIDVWKRRRWTTIFLWIGANAITLYLVNNMANLHQIAKRMVGGDVAQFFDTRFVAGAGDLVIALVALTLTVALAGYLYRRKIFLRV